MATTGASGTTIANNRAYVTHPRCRGLVGRIVPQRRPETLAFLCLWRNLASQCRKKHYDMALVGASAIQRVDRAEGLREKLSAQCAQLS